MTFNQSYDPPPTTTPPTIHWSESVGEGALAAAVMGLTMASQALTSAAQQMATAAALLAEQMQMRREPPEKTPGATRGQGRGR